MEKLIRYNQGSLYGIKVTKPRRYPIGLVRFVSIIVTENTASFHAKTFKILRARHNCSGVFSVVENFPRNPSPSSSYKMKA